MRLKSEKLICAGLWLAMVAVSVWGWLTLPDAPMAIHFGAEGTANGFAPRDIALSIMPGLALALMVVLLWFMPAIMPKNASIDRSAGAYGAVMVAVLALLLLIHGVLVLSAKGAELDHLRIVHGGVGVLIVILGNYLPKTRLNYIMGIRTPWTLADERVWDKTHRFAGPLFVLAGLVVVVGAFLLTGVHLIILMMVAVTVPALVSIIYSYLAAKKLGAV